MRIFENILRKSRNTKHKKEKLNKLLSDRGIPGSVYYVFGVGWMYQGQSIGYQYFSARSLIENGVLDYLGKNI